VITPRTPRSNRPPSERASDVSAGQDDDEDLVLVPSSRPPGSRQSGEWTEEGPNSGGPESESPHSEPPPKNVQERVRKLNARERDHLARQGTLTERVALERAYGSVVWEALLSNPALTGPEIARIAKNGTITQPHLKIIVHNASWLSKGEVRRALLSNPRLTVPHAERVLRALPPAELRQLPTQTAYPPQVRALARKMLPKTS
jgi:hypothetical protein